MFPDYDGLRDDLEELTEVEETDFGELGFTVDGVYRVIVQGNPHKYHVRLRDGTRLEAMHKGACPAIPDLPVEIDYDQFRRPFIIAPDKNQIESFTADLGITANYEVGLHSHHRGSGMEFPVDWRLFYQFNPQLSENYEIVFNEGWFIHNNTYEYFAGQTIDFAGDLPSANGLSRWVVVYLNPTGVTTVLERDLGPEVQNLSGLTKNDLESIIDISTSRIPICGVKLKTPSTRLEDRNIESLIPMMSLGSTTTDRGVIVVSEGDVVTQNGRVLRWNGTDLFHLDIP